MPSLAECRQKSDRVETLRRVVADLKRVARKMPAGANRVTVRDCVDELESMLPIEDEVPR